MDYGIFNTEYRIRAYVILLHAYAHGGPWFIVSSREGFEHQHAESGLGSDQHQRTETRLGSPATALRRVSPTGV